MTDDYRKRFEDILGAEIEKRLTGQAEEWFKSPDGPPSSPSGWWWDIRKATDALYRVAPDTLPNRSSVDPAGDRERYEEELIHIAGLAIAAVRESRRKVYAESH